MRVLQSIFDLRGARFKYNSQIKVDKINDHDSNRSSSKLAARAVGGVSTGSLYSSLAGENSIAVQIFCPVALVLHLVFENGGIITKDGHCKMS